MCYQASVTTHQGARKTLVTTLLKFEVSEVGMTKQILAVSRFIMGYVQVHRIRCQKYFQDNKALETPTRALQTVLIRDETIHRI